MQVNKLPPYDSTDNPTGCCPRFNPAGWDDQDLHFEDKLFVKATTKSQNYVPIDMGQVFQDTFSAIEDAGAYAVDDFIVLSRDVSPSGAEHYFSVSRPVPDREMVRWTGDYLTKVFEGPFENGPEWERAMADTAKAHSKEAKQVYYFYTTCPKCAEIYGKNYVVGVAELA